MTVLRKTILAIGFLAALLAPFAALGQSPYPPGPPAPVPGLPDSARQTTYTITSSTCGTGCPVGFQLYGDSTDYQNWIEVWLNGVQVQYNDPIYGWTITSPTGSLATIPRPITDAYLTFNNPQSGTVVIVGAERPRRTTEFAEGQGVDARDLNQNFNNLTAIDRELWDKTNDLTGRGLFFAPGTTTGPMPTTSQCAGALLGFDATGKNPICTTLSGSAAGVSSVNSYTGAVAIQAGTGITVTNPGGGVIQIANTASVIPSLGVPGGRLSLVSGQATMSADTTSQTLYYAPYSGNTIPIYNGSTWADYQFTSSPTDQTGLSLAIGGSANWPAGTIFDVFAIDNSGTIQLATRAWDSSMLPSYTQISSPSNTTITTGTNTATWSNASAAFDGTLSKTISSSAATNSNSTADLNNCLGQDLGSGHAYALTKVALTEPNNGSFRGDDPTTVVISTYGSSDDINWQRLDANRNVLSTSATYGDTYTYYINDLDATPYRYLRVCFTGTGTSNNLHVAQIQFFTTTAPSTRRLALYNGVPVNDATTTMRISASSTLSVPQYEGTYLGSFETDAGTAGQITADFGYGINRVMDIWNYYHRKKVTLVAGIPATASGLPASVTYRYNLAWPANQDWSGVQSSTDYSVQVLVGYTGDTVQGSFSRAWYINGTANQANAYEFGIGVDNTISFSGSEGGFTGDDIAAGFAAGLFGNTGVTIPPFFGSHTLYGIEKLTYDPAGTVTAFENLQNTALYVHTTY